MKKVAFVLVASIGLLFAGCSSSNSPEEATPVNPQAVDLSKDSTRYGLACEGCTDSVVYFLPESYADPIKYDILDARFENRVFGHPRIGDNIAILVNPEDTTEASFVADLNDLMGTWCYVVMPKMRDFGKMSKKMQTRFMKNMPDSLRQNYLVPREYGFTLKNQWNATPVGMMQQTTALEDESPVVYPALPFYRQWHLLNGKLILSRALMPVTKEVETAKKGNEGVKGKDGKAAKEKELVMRFVNDTTDIVFLGPDSLVLQFKDHQQSYYRLSDASDANKLAREKAQKLARDAQNQVKNE